ncbi:hypothetical protein J2S08_000157 [Bacillus chungangensis]|uniref:Uncharacterized protein n=1 Tax=Bacillus chungangensis TaxID=587633 RepID=A0ABT9WM44_9BACI|nr:hypothetical protein [Bacillus chungangensis]
MAKESSLSRFYPMEDAGGVEISKRMENGG